MSKYVLTAIALFLSLTSASMANAERKAPLSPTPPSPVLQIDAQPRAYFVELHGAPAAEGGSATRLSAEKASFRGAALKAGVRLRERHRFTKLWNGLSVEMAPADVARLAGLPEVKAVHPVQEVPAPEVRTGIDPNLATALTMTQADIARDELGLTGRGIRVAVIDSGIDYDHPDLGGCFGPGCRVEVGYDFVGDAYNANPNQPSFNPVAVPDLLPDDCMGHGTHVAGIAGANGQVRGVAPEVTFGAYRVFGCQGSTSNDILLAALERVYDDGADVVNMSLGGVFSWPDNPVTKAADRLVRKGVVVVGSIGNSGHLGLYTGGGVAVGERVIGVASFDNTHFSVSTFNVSPDGRPFEFVPLLDSGTVPGSGTFPLARTGTAASAQDACDGAAPAPGSLTGKVALIRFASCPPAEQALNAKAAGAVAVIFYDLSVSYLPFGMSVGSAVGLPAILIFGDDGLLLDNRLAAGPVDVTWTGQVASYPYPFGSLIADGSSYGVAPDLSLKPDLGAPGGLIRSTFPLEHGGYALFSGTSMAAPHVAGAAALILQARPRTRAEDVRTLLQNSATPQPWWGDPTLGFLDNVHRQGAGLLRIADAIRSTARVEPGKLSLGESEGGPAVHTLTVENDGAAAVTYTLSHSPALATGPNTFSPEFSTSSAAVTFSASTLTVPAGRQARVRVTITAPSGLADRSLYGGYLVLTPQTGGPALRVPYAGFKGDYQSIPVLTPTVQGFPWLVKLTEAGPVHQPDGATYTMAGNDLPAIAYHLDHQAEQMEMEVLDADTGRTWTRLFKEDHTPRNNGPATFFLEVWDGTRQQGNRTLLAPDGRYVIKITVLRALGKKNNPAHVETWTSPVFTIDWD